MVAQSSHNPTHAWKVSDEEARDIQLSLAPLVSRSRATDQEPVLVAGVDVSGPDIQGYAVGAVVVLKLPEFEVVEVSLESGDLEFRYRRSLLAFREAPLIVAALERLETKPDLVLVDGHGIAHPRRFGLASHVGVLTGIPTIGCAKSLLVGQHDFLGHQIGSHTPLNENGEVIGTVLRTRDGTKPMYISVGHKLDLEWAVEWVLKCCVRYRTPEPLRAAHRAARR